MEKTNVPKDLSYWVTLFKLEGHQTWRIHLGPGKDSFEREKKNWSSNPKSAAKITDIKHFRIDRMTSEIIELKS